MLSVISNDRIVPFQTAQGRTNNVSNEGSQRSKSKITVLVILHQTGSLGPSLEKGHDKSSVIPSVIPSIRLLILDDDIFGAYTDSDFTQLQTPSQMATPFIPAIESSKT